MSSYYRIGLVFGRFIVWPLVATEVSALYQ